MNINRDNTKTKRIKTVILVSLLVLAAANIFLLLLINKTSQTSLIEIQPSSTISSKIVNPTSTPLTLDNSNPTIQNETSIPDFIPNSSSDGGGSDLRSPFSLQIAALHQISINTRDLENESNLDESVYSSLADALTDSGADWTRVRIEWELIEPNEPVPDQQPEYDWQYHDDNLRLVAATGVKMIATISDSPSWAASFPCGPLYSDRLDEFARYLTDLVKHYKEPPFNIQHWELVNEPDSNRYISGHFTGHGCWAYDGDLYAQMLAIANQAIKEVDPQATVIMGGIAYDWFEEYGGPFYRYFSDDAMVNGGGNHIDALNFHFFTDFHEEWDRWNPNSDDRRYGWIPAPTCGNVDDGVGTPYDVEGFDVVAKITHFRNRMNVCFGVSTPVWLTEVGVHGFPDDKGSLINQARYVIKVYARALSAGVQNITWFSLDQPPYDRFGQALLNPDFSPKPAFFAYQTLTSELDGFYEYSHSRNTCSWNSAGASCPVEAYIFKDGFSEEKTVAWGSSLLSFQADELRVVDRDGNEIFIMDGGDGDEDGELNGSVKLQLSAEPVFVSMR